ncbi:MAG: hypothetical protein ABFD81_19975, partial [Syntrophaceae bacterium]
YLATSPEVASVTGKYFVKCREKRSSKSSYDVKLRKRLWEETERFYKSIRVVDPKKPITRLSG